MSIRRNCLYCGKAIVLDNPNQESVCKNPSAKCRRIRDDAKAKLDEDRKKEARSTPQPTSHSEQTERYGADVRNDDGDVVSVQDLNKSEVRVEDAQTPLPNDIGPDKKKGSRFHTPAFPIVPSGDPLAPLGRDDDGKPIKPMRTDREIHSAMLESYKPSYDPCPHKNDPAHCVICKGGRGEPLPQTKVDPVSARPRPAPVVHADSDIFSASKRILRDRQIAEAVKRRDLLLTSWEARRIKLTSERDELSEKERQEPSEQNRQAYYLAQDNLDGEAHKATSAIRKINDEISRLSSVSLREELNISQTQIVQWLGCHEILYDSWTETVFDTRQVRREIKQAEKPPQEPAHFEILSAPQQIQNLKRFSRNARKDNPSWDDKHVRQYRYDLKKQIRGLSALMKEQARKPKPKPPTVPEPQYEIVVENVSREETRFDAIFNPDTVSEYKDMIAFRIPQVTSWTNLRTRLSAARTKLAYSNHLRRASENFPSLNTAGGLAGTALAG